MSSAAAVALEVEVPWSRWFHCESSFDLVLVPSQPGLYSIAEEVIVDPAVNETLRAFNVVKFGQAEDLFHDLSQLFGARSELRDGLVHGRIFLRFGVVADPEVRHAGVAALNAWLQSDTADDDGFVLGFGRRPAAIADFAE